MVSKPNQSWSATTYVDQLVDKQREAQKAKKPRLPFIPEHIRELRIQERYYKREWQKYGKPQFREESKRYGKLVKTEIQQYREWIQLVYGSKVIDSQNPGVLCIPAGKTQAEFETEMCFYQSLDFKRFKTVSDLLKKGTDILNLLEVHMEYKDITAAVKDFRASLKMQAEQGSDGNNIKTSEITSSASPYMDGAEDRISYLLSVLEQLRNYGLQKNNLTLLESL